MGISTILLIGSTLLLLAELWNDKLTDEMMRTEAPLDLSVGRARRSEAAPTPWAVQH